MASDQVEGAPGAQHDGDRHRHIQHISVKTALKAGQERVQSAPAPQLVGPAAQRADRGHRLRNIGVGDEGGAVRQLVGPGDITDGVAERAVVFIRPGRKKLLVAAFQRHGFGVGLDDGGCACRKAGGFCARAIETGREDAVAALPVHDRTAGLSVHDENVGEIAPQGRLPSLRGID